MVNSERGQPDRPHLTTRNRLVGTGAFAPQPVHDADYRRGYLCGIVRGDGTLGEYECRRASGSSYTAYRFRLALTDLEALRRARDFLATADVETGQRLFQRAAGRAPRGDGDLRSEPPRRSSGSRALIEWPLLPSLQWCRGFLAGIFDAEGCRSDYALRIANTDPQILAWTEACARRFGFDVAVDQTEQRKRSQVPPDPRRPLGAPALLPPDRPGDQPQARHRRADGQDVRQAEGRRDRAAREGAAVLRHHDRHRRLHRQRRGQPQLLCAADPQVPGLRRRPGLRARDRGQGQCAGAAACRARAGRHGKASTWRLARTRIRISGSRADTA